MTAPVDPADLWVDLRRDVRIPTRDGLELSANLFLPSFVPEWLEDDLDEPFDGRGPVILNVDPYRKDDWSAGWDLSLASYLARNGYAYCRLDIRGTGSSGGVAMDEYTEAETLDGHDAVEWLAKQPWCNGRVGMWGLSYGGFTSIQVAATRPPSLKAIVAVQATDDRYTDDVHYVGGAMTVSELSQYAVSQVAMNALPATPSAWGDAWLDRWRERLEATPVWLFEWARQQRDGPYWRVGSLAPEYGRIEAAVLSIGGWMDEYVDAAIRMQARCVNAVARKTIVGPWVHGLPHHAYPAPNIDWLASSMRWFDRWLWDSVHAAENDPAITWFHREPTEPERFPKRLNGAWRATADWPPSAPTTRVFALDGGEAASRGRLQAEATASGIDTFQHRPTAGVRGGSLCWGAGHPPNGLALDLRIEESFGPSYVSDPLSDDLDVLGAPVVVVHVSSHQPVAHIVARLGCVLPDGSIEQVSEGILNLTHRNSHADPTPLEAGRTYEVRIPLRSAGYRFPAGHRIHLSFASAHWPVVWPSPGENELTIHRSSETPSRLELPLAPELGHQIVILKDTPPELVEVGSETSEPTNWDLSEAEDGSVTIRTHEGSTSVLPDGTSTLYVGETLAMTASEREPGSGRFENACEYRLDKDGHLIVVVADGTTVATSAAFEMDVGLRVDLDGERFFEREWHEVIPRDLL